MKTRHLDSLRLGADDRTVLEHTDFLAINDLKGHAFTPYGDDRAMPHGKSGGGKKPSAAQTGGRRNDAPRGGQSPKNSGADKPKNFKRKSGWAKPKPTAKSKKR